MYKMPSGGFTPEEYEDAINHAIALELTTIPCYLSTYYSINRTPDQDTLYSMLLSQVTDDALAKELTMDILMYANKSAGIIMSVAVEEMLHLSLASNIKQATIGPPNLMDIGASLTYPATLFAPKPGKPEFKINRGPLSIDQLIILLKIESPNRFGDKAYETIGEFYAEIRNYIDNQITEEDWQVRKGQPQLVPTQPYYAQNTINTIYYNKQHEPQFPSQEGSGGIIEVIDQVTADHAMREITEQGEGYPHGDTLEFVDGKPKPLPIVDGQVVFDPEDYDTPGELSHFAKFMELYTLALHFEEKFESVDGTKPFFSYFVKPQAVNPQQTDYSSNTDGLPELNNVANAIYTYILLMIETCYYQKLPVQFEVFMMGIHKSMIWLLSELAESISKKAYDKTDGSVTFEFYLFDPDSSPKAQLISLAKDLIAKDSSYDWLVSNRKYLPSLPDVALDHQVSQMPFFTPTTTQHV